MDELENFTKETFTFQGNWRAIVEDNEDPLDAGRVRVRILGIHSLDPALTPVDHLPWAEPCLKPYYSGGMNLDNPDSYNGQRYSPTETFIPPPRDIKGQSIDFIDSSMEQQGTGGWFGSVPRKGSQIWVFFEAGNHMRPHYWACAPRSQDWNRQRDKIVNDIQSKINNVTELKNEFNPDTKEYTGKSCSSSAKVGVKTNKPKFNINQLGEEDKNCYITSFTSPGGVTYIFLNRDGTERTYIMHKGTLEYTDEFGQKKTLVGTTDSKNNDYEQLIANNYELHINGEFDIFVNKSCFIQVEKDAQINVKGNCGVVSREGDIDIISNNSNVNIDTGKNCNIHSRGNIQLHAENDMIFEVGRDFSLKVNGNVDVDISNSYRVKAAEYNLTTVLNQIYSCLSVDFTSKTGINLKGGSIVGLGAPLVSINADGGIFNKSAMISLAAPTVLAGGTVNMGAAQAGPPTTTRNPASPTLKKFDKVGADKDIEENPPFTS